MAKSLRLPFYSLLALSLFAFFIGCSSSKSDSSGQLKPIDGTEIIPTSPIMHDTPKIGSVKFKATSSDADSYSWNIAGTDYSGKEVAHSFTAAGDYDVSLTTQKGDEKKVAKGVITIPKKPADESSYIIDNIEIDMGSKHTLIAIGGKLFIYGDNSSGQTCSDNKIPFPSLLQNFNEVTSVAAGNEHTLFVNNRIIYACGKNDKGQLGTGDNLNSSEPKPIKFEFQEAFNKVYTIAGGDYSFFATEYEDASKPKVMFYSFGFNGDGSYINTPAVIKQKGGADFTAQGARNNPRIAAGNNFALIRATTAYNLFSLGVNDKWQLGKIQTTTEGNYDVDANNPDLHTEKNLTDMNAYYVYTPYGQEGSSVTYLQNNEDTELAAGEDFSIVVNKEAASRWSSEKNSVYVWGNNDKGQLGFKNKNSLTYVRRGTALFSKTATEAAATDPNSVKPIDADISYVAAGADFGLALDNSTKILYAWGNTEAGNNAWITGVATSENENVKKLTGTYKRVWAGGHRVIALNSDNNLVTWGDNAEGILGVGQEDENILTPTTLFFNLSTNEE